MKKVLCITLILLAIISCLTACNITTNVSNIGNGQAESTPQAQEMMSAISENRISDAKALLHPNASENKDIGLEQMISYINGRTVTSLKRRNINVTTSSNSEGKTRQEQVVYETTLSDGEIVYLSVVYITSPDGEGFASFQLVLGVV